MVVWSCVVQYKNGTFCLYVQDDLANDDVMILDNGQEVNRFVHWLCSSEVVIVVVLIGRCFYGSDQEVVKLKENWLQSLHRCGTVHIFR